VVRERADGEAAEGHDPQEELQEHRVALGEQDVLEHVMGQPAELQHSQDEGRQEAGGVDLSTSDPAEVQVVRSGEGAREDGACHEHEGAPLNHRSGRDQRTQHGEPRGRAEDEPPPRRQRSPRDVPLLKGVRQDTHAHHPPPHQLSQPPEWVHLRS